MYVPVWYLDPLGLGRPVLESSVASARGLPGQIPSTKKGPRQVGSLEHVVRASELQDSRIKESFSGFRWLLFRASAH